MVKKIKKPEMYLLYRTEGILNLSNEDIEILLPYFMKEKIDNQNYYIGKKLIEMGLLPLTVDFLNKHKKFSFLPLPNMKGKKFTLREV